MHEPGRWFDSARARPGSCGVMSGGALRLDQSVEIRDRLGAQLLIGQAELVHDPSASLDWTPRRQWPYRTSYPPGREWRGQPGCPPRPSASCAPATRLASRRPPSVWRCAVAKVGEVMPPSSIRAGDAVLSAHRFAAPPPCARLARDADHRYPATSAPLCARDPTGAARPRCVAPRLGRETPRSKRSAPGS
jgi:hypothetical protein